MISRTREEWRLSLIWILARLARDIEKKPEKESDSAKWRNRTGGWFMFFLSSFIQWMVVICHGTVVFQLDRDVNESQPQWASVILRIDNVNQLVETKNPIDYSPEWSFKCN